MGAPTLARLLRGEVDPWETLPLNNPPFNWARKTQLCQNSASHKVLTTFTQNVVFYLVARGLVAHTAVWGLGGQGGHPKSIKKRHEKMCSKRGPKSALGGSMGAPGSPRNPNIAKMGAK